MGDNALMYFTIARARTRDVQAVSSTGMEDVPDVWGAHRSSLPQPLIDRLGAEHIDFCPHLAKGCVLQGSGSSTMERADVLAYLRDLADAVRPNSAPELW